MLGVVVVVVPGVSSPKGSSYLSFLGVLSPKGSWGGVNDTALASGLSSSFVLGVLSPRGSFLSFLGVLSPKESWGGVDDAALASGCRTEMKRRWAILQSPPTI